jgi:phosphonate transport system substrate-binding protein
MRARKLLWVVLAFSLVAAACGDDGGTTTTGATTPPAGDGLTQTEGVLTVGSDIPYPPFEDFDEATGDVIGFDADLINELASRLGLTVEWVDTDFDTIFTQLATGRFDVVASATTITPERSQQVNFTTPYYNAQQSLTVNTNLTPEIGSTDDLGDGDRVAAQTGTTGLDWALENLAPLGVEVVEFPAAPDTYTALEGGQVVGVVNDAPSAEAEVANREGLRIVQIFETGEEYGFGVDPARAELLTSLNSAFADMLEDGTYQSIYDDWFDSQANSVLYEPPTLGTAENPIQVVFLPSGSAEDIVAGGEVLREALNESTGLFFEVSVPTSYAATIEAMCAAPDSTIGFISSAAFAFGDALCGMEMPVKSDRFGDVVYWTAFAVARDSDIETIEDLDGLSWGFPDTGSTSGYMVPLGVLKAAGVEPGEQIEFGGSHTATARGIYTGDVDFATFYYNGWTDPAGDVVLWDYTAENADIPDESVANCDYDEAEGEIVCDGLTPRDARRAIREEAPDVVQKVRILTLSDIEGIPNDGLAFPNAFPEDLKDIIVAALFAFQENDLEGFQTAFDTYSWDGIVEATDAEFDGIRALVEASGVDLESLS